MFTIIDVESQQFPDYIKSVPTLVVEQNMIKADDVFGYLNNMVQQIFEQYPELKQKYHPEQRAPSQPQQQQPQQQQSQQQQPQQQQSQQQQPQQQQPQQQQQQLKDNVPGNPGKGPSYDPVDDLVGWCPGGGGCSFANISDQDDNCSKQEVPLEDTNFTFITDGDDKLSQSTPQKVPMEQDNSQFQQSAKRQQMDSSYTRLMAERDLLK